MIFLKYLRVLSVIILVTIASPARSAIIVPGSPSSQAMKTDDPRALQLLQRLEDIRSSNKSELTNVEKKNLRKEVKAIKKELKPLKGGVYLSVGAIIIIILLLILLV
ncbi:MAG: hypothetical protein H7Y01_09325 [Ferruginibacter sp.]|nr:hypothetical protein [Chitinophagaceae bacterium]